ncbi:MAG: hypothetical protein ACYS0K_23295 [Planctomycetota bacterium]|jgi:hypothetical protein
MKRIFVLTLIAFLALAGEKQQARPYVTLAGARSEIKMAEDHRIATQEELTAVWLKHVGADPSRHSDYYNKAGVPVVDLDRCMVVAVFGGRCINSAGIHVVSVAEEKDRVLLRFDHRSYQSGAEGDRVTPFGFFFMPRSGKPLVLEENVQNLIGGPPKWKERARFDAIGR